ncbi:MAG: tRNA preQ1(34) S-adenosylmethionine ribosyltransferase-isomerase QueA [Deltaproteobacteria bacterium]|nr:tRNA preQ1(34) S-adenosylmethionine ribosyltransferase-isomerase QueA [Deltaproteobacteria bacterium]
MDLKDFTFDLPESLIAQEPLGERDSSRLMTVSKKDGAIGHRFFRDFPMCLRPGDLLVLNDTKVIPTRLLGAKPTGGKVELLLVEKTDAGVEEWKCLAKPAKGLKPGTKVLFDGVEGEMLGQDEEGLFICRFSSALDLEKIGKVPLPPYIKREATDADLSRYQTVFAGVDGAVAAPTAGLHFTGELLAVIKAMGVEVCHVTLHTGPGTFMPVRVEKIEEHRMMMERYRIDASVFSRVMKAKEEGRRVVAVGTTSTRALEACAASGLDSPALEGSTNLFIYPGYRFKVVDALLTNFHLPESTLLMLVSAFAGRELVLNAYKEAVRKEYRFFSYGDAMFIE